MDFNFDPTPEQKERPVISTMNMRDLKALNLHEIAQLGITDRDFWTRNGAKYSIDRRKEALFARPELAKSYKEISKQLREQRNGA